MKDGRTHLAHKLEHAVDMDSGAVVAVTVQDAAEGDSHSLEATVQEAQASLAALPQSGSQSNKSLTSQQRHDDVPARRGYSQLRRRARPRSSMLEEQT